ncbi:tld family protein, putative [Ichthyophthirius multifiliis]|uniref:Oxidation resistance protein 1 n=1 Tax=Ichthyophthirius multifiliis TaxID=5932 RepID=G0R332_ICHMU|nr:tld family protein, putative [Ichthyophthirius multifiliis]EGR28108.1 tld family protein, putative [Ichthyophthirius multifiliis]|eukprot:XP_004027453.1 tld family protein, putative [Ichthyophthirius multifiliis]
MTGIIGAFQKNQWNNQLGYQGDSQNFLFTLHPKFQCFYPYEGQGGTFYSYMNNKEINKSKYQVGMGFGGDDNFKKYRLWIDKEITEKSYVNCFDLTYGGGNLLPKSSETKLDIKIMEIWGIGSEENLIFQQEYRENERRELERMRKVDKKAMWDNGFVQNNMLGKLTSYKDQMREEVKRPDQDEQIQ